MSKATGLIIFVLGAATGSVVTWQFAKKKYEQIAEEEINSVKEVFSKREQDATDVEITVEPQPSVEASLKKFEEKPDISTYAEILKNEAYIPEGTEMEENKPYVISPDEFGEFEDYDQISLTYYADQVLVDDGGDKIEDVDDVVGMESLTRFGEYEDDSVFVRNDRLKCDYEILMDERTYSEAQKERPHQREA
ncbi:MAG: hypothetical protein NC413_04455 [Muribaculum sp.]|nr:hypothetical protein [Muribaculum sp.]